jgi:hypothetical protein
MRLSAIPQAAFASRDLKGPPVRVVEVRAGGGVDDVGMLLHKVLQVMRSRRVVDENEYLWINLALSSLKYF